MATKTTVRSRKARKRENGKTRKRENERFGAQPLLVFSLLAGWLLGWCQLTRAENFDLRSDTTVYSWRASDFSFNQIYQNLRLSLKEIGGKDIALRTNLRYRNTINQTRTSNVIASKAKQSSFLAQRFQFYTAYLDWKDALPHLSLQLGRSYPIIGSATGLLDGVDAVYQPTRALRFDSFAGVVVKPYRPYGEKKLEHLRFGLGMSYNRLPTLRTEAYFAQELYQGKTFKQLLGLTGYAAPFNKVTTYAWTQVDVHHRELSSLLSRAEYELASGLSVYLEYAHRAPRFQLVQKTEQVMSLRAKRSNQASLPSFRLPVYRELTTGSNIRIASNFSLGLEYGVDMTLGRRSPNLRIHWTVFNLFKSGFDSRIAFQKRGGTNNYQSVSSFSVNKEIGTKFSLGLDFQSLQYKPGEGVHYRSRSLGANISYKIAKYLNISAEVERIFLRNAQANNTILMNVSYAFYETLQKSPRKLPL